MQDLTNRIGDSQPSLLASLTALTDSNQTTLSASHSVEYGNYHPNDEDQIPSYAMRLINQAARAAGAYSTWSSALNFLRVVHAATRTATRHDSLPMHVESLIAPNCQRHSETKRCFFRIIILASHGSSYLLTSAGKM